MSATPSYPPASRKIMNVVMLSLTGLCTLLVLSVLFTILGYLLWKGVHALNLNFFINLPAPVGESGGGVANAIVGTLKLLGMATLIGVPIGLLGGIYLSEFAGGWSAFAVRYTTDLLNGVPSVVMGIFVYTLVVLPMHHFSTLAGGIALGIMMIPIALRSTEDFLRAVPRSLREGGLALGASKSETIFTIVIPAAIYGILTGVMLDIARVAGETAPLLFTAFGNQFNSPGWMQPTASLPVVIYNYAISPYDEWHQQAWAAGFVLLSGLLVVSILARMILARGKKMSHG
ncbi:MAG TPA: phosphate ABC transporter permease PstA [Acidobacteriaceae bacterium]|nr:phosphate ABC transporter permease PstA [Acidobacteriaceae bacterium]